MKKLLSLLSVLTISGTAMPNVIAGSNYGKEEQNTEAQDEIINIGEKKYKKEKIKFLKKIVNMFFDKENIPYVVVENEKQNKRNIEVYNLLTNKIENSLNNIENLVNKSNFVFKFKNNILFKDNTELKNKVELFKYNKNNIYLSDNKQDIYKYEMERNNFTQIYANPIGNKKILIDFVVSNDDKYLYFIQENEKYINIYNLSEKIIEKKQLDYFPLTLAIDKDSNNIYCAGKKVFIFLKQNNILDINNNNNNNFKKIFIDNNNDIYYINFKDEIIKMTQIDNINKQKLSNNNFFKNNWIYFATIPITFIIFISSIFVFLYIKKRHKIKHKLIKINNCNCKTCKKILHNKT